MCKGAWRGWWWVWACSVGVVWRELVVLLCRSESGRRHWWDFLKIDIEIQSLF